jgi:hypothetical protein
LKPILPLHPDPTMQRVLTQRANEAEVEFLLDHTRLPAPVITGRPEAVHVMVADVDDLGQWLTERGGEIHVSPPFEGVQLWMLHTTTEPRSDGSCVRVLVSAPVPAGEAVMQCIRAAVAA